MSKTISNTQLVPLTIGRVKKLIDRISKNIENCNVTYYEGFLASEFQYDLRVVRKGDSKDSYSYYYRATNKLSPFCGVVRIDVADEDVEVLQKAVRFVNRKCDVNVEPEHKYGNATVFFGI